MEAPLKPVPGLLAPWGFVRGGEAFVEQIKDGEEEKRFVEVFVARPIRR
jgi:hypothetical protein